MEAIAADDWRRVAELMLDSARLLALAALRAATGSA